MKTKTLKKEILIAIANGATNTRDILRAINSRYEYSTYCEAIADLQVCGRIKFTADGYTLEK